MDWSKVKVKVQPRSGFDKSHSRKTTSFCGTLKPLLVDELLPNSEFNGSFGCQINMAPLVSDVDPRCDYALEAFLVPHRLLWGGFESWLTSKTNKSFIDGSLSDVRALMPYIAIAGQEAQAVVGPDSLLASLGMSTALTPSSGSFSILPFLAYHRIYDDWYRNAKIQTPVFSPLDFRLGASQSTYIYQLSRLPYLVSRYDITTPISYSPEDTFDDGCSLGSLRQRNFDSDMFTEAMANEQFGDAQSITIDTSGNSTSLTIKAIRVANAMQQFEERNNLASPRLQDFVKSQYGADLSSGVADRAICIGSARIPIKVGSVASTVAQPSSDISSSNYTDLTKALGYRGGTAYLDDNNVFHFHGKVNEPCYLMVIGSLVPKAQYASGIDPILLRYTESDGTGQSDMANSILQNVGLEAIPATLLNGTPLANANTFGYTDRYFAWMDKRDFVDGLFGESQSLSAFTPKRSFDEDLVISSSFLEIPKSFLDEITAVDSYISGFTYMLDGYFKYGVSQPLQKYGIPTLQDPAYEHGKTVTLQRNGSRL